MNLKIIDPNKLGEGGFSAQMEDLCIDLQLTAIKKGKTLVLAEGKAFNSDQEKELSVDLLKGQTFGGSQYLSTLFTEIGSQYDTLDDNGGFKDFETLGITSVDIEFNASNVPVVKMSMTDVRGRLFQQGNNSPYNLFFEFPYPMFRFRAKGFYGKTINYDLHLVKFNTQFNPDNGGFDINCEFIGFSYAYLSDLLIGYIRAVPYTTIGSELVGDVGKTFQEYQDDAFKLAEIAKNLAKSSVNTALEEQKNGSIQLESLKEFVDDELKKIGDKEVKRNIYTSSKGYYLIVQNSKNDNEKDKGEIKNLTDIFNQKITDDQSYGGKVLTFNISHNLNIEVGNNPLEFMTKIEEKNKGNEAIITLFRNAVDAEVGNSNKKNVKFTYIDVSKTFKNIDEILATLKSEITTNEDAKLEEFSNSLSISGLTPTIGEYFQLICNHSDLLWASIHKVAQNVLNDTNRKSQFKDLEMVGSSKDNEANKILPFPEFKKKDGDVYVDDWIGKAAADGAIIPEAQFVEELIKGFLKAYKEIKALNDKLNSFEQDTETEVMQTGSLNYIPIHPADSPIGGSTSTMPYNGITDYDKFIERFSTRILSFFSLQIVNEDELYDFDETVLKKLAEIEAYNVNLRAKNVNSLASLISTNAVDSGLETEILGIAAEDGMKSKLVSDIASSISKKVNVYKDKKGWQTFVPSNGKYYTSFKPDGIKVGYYASYYSDGKFKTIGSETDGEFIHIHNTEDVSSMGISGIDISLDNENKSITNNLKQFSQTFGPFYYEKNVGGTTKAEGSLLFYNHKAITNQKTVLSYFSPNEAPTNINGANVKNNALNGITDTSVKGKKLEEQIQKVSFVKGLESNESYLSDIPIIINGQYSSLFMSPFFQLQTTKTKAFLLLHSLPFKYDPKGFFPRDINNPNKVNNSSYFENMLMGMFSIRSGIVKTSYAWAALVGGLCEYYDNKDQKPDFRINFKVKGTWYIQGGKYTGSLAKTDKDPNSYFLKHDRTLISESCSFYENSAIGLIFGETTAGSRELGSMPKFITMMPKSAKVKFKAIFNDFVNHFKTNIEPHTKLFGNKPNFNLITENIVKEGVIDMTSLGATANVIAQYNYINLNTPGYNRSYYGGDKLYNTGNNFCKFKKDSIISLEIFNLIKRNVFVSILNPAPFRRYADIVTENRTHKIKSRHIHTVLKAFNSAVTSVIVNPIDGSNGESQEMLELKQSIGLNESDDIRIKVYKDIKSIYEKWVNGDTSMKELYKKFKFQNRHYKDISDEFKINPLNLIKDLMGNLHQPLISHISKVLAENNFNFLPTPSYIDIHNYQEMKDLFKPYRWVDSIETSESMFVCMYVGEFSSKLDTQNTGNYQNDGITLGINDFSTVPEITDITATDFLTDKDIPIIRVKFGDQQQSIFTKFGLDQTEFTITNESLVVTDSLTQKNGLSQNLFDVYLSRSYTLNLEMLGNFMIQPFMYLYLENIPMFYGLYYIIKASHKVTPNSVITTVKAVRMRQTMTKMLDDSTLYNNLISIYQDAQIDGSNNGTIEGGFGTVNSNYLYDLVTSEVVSTDTLHVSDKDESWLLREAHEFILDVSREWAKFNDVEKKYGKMLVYTAGSLKGGGKTKKHSSHQKGVDIDLRVLKEGYDSWTSGGNSNTGDYSKEAFLKLLEILNKVGTSPKYSQLVGGKNFFELVGFSIPGVKDPQVKTTWANHHHHYHVRVRVPDYITEDVSKRKIGPTGAYPGGSGGAGMPGVDSSDTKIGKGDRIKKLQASLGVAQTGEFNQETFTKWKTKNGLSREQACHILGQMAAETEWFTVGSENLNYSSASRIREVYGKRISASEAQSFVGRPRELANRVYGTTNGNTPGTNDGFIFRGRGGVQITGRNGYKKYGDFLGVDLVSNPDLVNNEYYFDCGVFYCKEINKKVLQEASVMSTDAILKVSKGINAGSVNSPKTPHAMGIRNSRTMWFYNNFK